MKRVFLILTVVTTVLAVAGALNAATFTVTNTSSSSSDSGSLAWAIAQANANPDLDDINFNIPGLGPHTIQACQLLINNPVVIDGYTQPGAVSANGTTPATLEIQINGGSCSAAWGLVFSQTTFTMRGLAINGFRGSQNGGGGVYVNQCQNGFVIEGNHIGTDVTGTTAVPNTHGMEIYYSNGGRIGGPDPASRNVISGNALTGVLLTQFSDNNLIQGNYIGTDATGTAAVGNGSNGIDSEINDYITVIGNVISGNGDDGIEMDGDINANWPWNVINPASYNILQNNKIGTDATGTVAIGNRGNGVYLIYAHQCKVGGTEPGESNIIANNGNAGVAVGRQDKNGIYGFKNSILGNSIYSNGGLGIDLWLMWGTDGVTANDPQDSDFMGGNNYQNYPDLAVATSYGSATRVQGAFNSHPNQTFRLEFFYGPTADSSGHGEGQFVLGYRDVTTDGNGDAVIDITFPIGVLDGYYVSSTATHPDGSTSEFGNVVRVQGGPPPLTGAISGVIWNDADSDAAIGGSEELLSGVTVFLYASDGTTLVATAITGADGSYTFTDRPAGNYVVDVDNDTLPFPCMTNTTANDPAGLPVTSGATTESNVGFVQCAEMDCDFNEFAILALNGGSLIVNSATSLAGDVGYSSGVKSTINQKVSIFNGSALVHSQVGAFGYTKKNFVPIGGILKGSNIDVKLDSANAAAVTASAYYASLAPTLVLGDLRDNDSIVVQSTGSLNVISISSVNYKEDFIKLVSRDGYNDYFIFNVAGDFDFAASKVILNGTTVDHVLFNFPGYSDIAIYKSESEFQGTILAPLSSIEYHNPAAFVGAIIGLNLNLHSGFNLTHRPFDCPPY